MLSSKAKYAVRAAVRLAESAGGETWVQTADVAERDHIPRKFLEAIFVVLRDHGLVESRRGARGGHRLAREPSAISVAEIIRLMDGPLALTPCASVTCFHQCGDCADITLCRLQPLMRRARDAVAAVLENCSLADLVGERSPTRGSPLPTQAAD